MNSKRNWRLETCAELVEALIVLGLLFLLPTAVFAHSNLVEASPKPGATVGTDIAEITMLFSEPVGAESEVLLFGEGFRLLPVTTSLNPSNSANLIAFIEQPLTVGEYSVQYTAVSPDGHEITGSYQFQVSNQKFGFNLTVNNLALMLTIFIGIVVFAHFRRSKQSSPTK